MNPFTNSILFLLRVVFGWFMLYAGITKVLDPNWSAAGFLANAKTFPEFYGWFMRPEILPHVNLFNEWGLILLGVSLILGMFVRGSALLGAVLMMLYYFPTFMFPYAGEHSYIVDEHIIYAVLLLFFAVADAGKAWGLDVVFAKPINNYNVRETRQP